MNADQHEGTASLERPKTGVTRRNRRRTAGDLEALRRELWHACRRVGDVLDDLDAEPGDLCRAANSLAALANAYRATTESAVLEVEVAELRRRVDALHGPSIRGRAA